MRINFVMAGGFNLSGGDRVISIYAERLAGRGHDVCVVASLPPPPTFREQVRSVLTAGRLIKPPPNTPPSHFTGLKVPHRRLESSRPVVASDLPDADVVVATWWETCEWVANLPPSKGVPVHFVQHYEAFDYLPKDRVDAALGLPFHKITISQWLVDLLRERFHSRSDLILNSVDTTQFNGPTRERNAIPKVGMLYATVPWKGTDVALRAFDIARKEFPNIVLRCFGASDPTVSPTLPLPQSATYEYRPRQSRIPEIYRECDVWLCGSRSEGFHLPPLEAMACRTPVVSTAVGGPVDIISNGVNGFVTPVGDADALGESLIRVLKLPSAEWRAMSEACHRTATGYTWDDATALFEKSLERALINART